ncbi:hypothetical protein GW916_04635 [bacterium]|nr:hypothetical protein [bacterium]
MDYKVGADKVHLLVELALALAASIGFVLVVKDSFEKEKALNQSRLQNLEKEKEAEKWRKESLKYIHGLSLAIDKQLESWQLTQAEKEVALLLLKGLSLKEIADVRSTTEKTARAQSGVIYSKSGLAGRSELSAFFLEDLLQPNSITENSK